MSNFFLDVRLDASDQKVPLSRGISLVWAYAELLIGCPFSATSPSHSR